MDKIRKNLEEKRKDLVIQMNYILNDNNIMMRRSELKKQNIYKVNGTHNNGGERLIYMELLKEYGESITDYGADIIYPPTSSGVIIIPIEDVIHYSYYEIIEENDKTFDFRIFEYVDNDLCYTLHKIIIAKDIPKTLPINCIKYEETTILNIWKEYSLKHNVTIFNEREKVILNNTLENLSFPDSEQARIIIYNTLRHFMSLNFLKTVYNDEKLKNKFRAIIGVNTCYENNGFYKISIRNNLSDSERNLLEKINKKENFIINKGGTLKIIKLLLSQKKIIDIDIAVGFVRKSGLDYIRRMINIDNKNKINLVIGALQNYDKNSVSNRMDRETAISINKMIDNNEINVFTYLKSFYHGKYYCFTDERMVYIIIGSSNISKNAFFNNYELDVFFKYEKESKEAKEFINWFYELKNNCEVVHKLNPNLYIDDNNIKDGNFNESKNMKEYKKVSINDFINKINELNDDEIKYRQQLWISKNPSAIYENLNLNGLKEYKLYIYKTYKIAVFESFKRNNAYYVVDNDNLDIIIDELKGKSKMQMFKSELYVVRGYHIKSKEKMEKKINRFFER